MPALGQRQSVQVTAQGKSDSTASGFYEDYDLSGVTKLEIHRWIPSANPLAGFITITDNTGDITIATIPVKTNLAKALELGFTLHNPDSGFVVSTSDGSMTGQLVVTPQAYKTSTGAPPSDPPPPPPDPDFGVFATPSANTIVAGGTAVFTISVVSLFGFSQNVTLSASPAITGVSYSFSSSTVQGAGSVGLTITTTALATVATHTITVTGVSGGLTHTVDFDLTINAGATPDFSLSVSPPSTVVVQGQAATVTVSNTAIAGFSSTINLAATPAISGITYGFSPNPMLAGASSVLTITAAAAATTGVHTVTVTATSGALSHTAPITLTVQPSSSSGETGTAIISMKNPTSVSSVNATLKAQIRFPDQYAPVVTFDYRAVGSTTWIATTPIGRCNHYRWANYFMHVPGLTPSTTYEYRVRTADIATGTLTNNSENLSSGSTVIQFTTKAVGDISTFGSRAITSGVTMPTYALPGSPASGLITEANPRLFTSLCARAGSAQAYDIIVYGTDNPSAKTAGTVEVYYVVTADAGTDFFTITSQSVNFLANTNNISFTSSGTVPAPLVSGTTYKVVALAGNTFKVEASVGSGAINLTSAGTGVITAKMTTSYSTHWMASATEGHAVIGSVIGLEGFDGLRATYATPVQTALTAAGHSPLYDGGGVGVTGSAWGYTLGGGSGTAATTWPGNVCITGISIVGIGTVQKATGAGDTATTHMVAGEPVLYANFASSGGGCNNVYFKNLKFMSVPGNSARIASGNGSAVNSLSAGTDSQFSGLLGFYDCEFRAFRENFQPISVDVDGDGQPDYQNDGGWGSKSHMRMIGNCRIDCRTSRASWNNEHWWYNEGTSSDVSGTDASWFITLSDFISIRATIDTVVTGFGRTAIQFTTRASPDSFKFKSQFFSGQNAHIHQLDDPAKFQQNNYIDGAPGRGLITLKSCNLNGYEGSGSAGSFPYGFYGHLGTIDIDSCTVGAGSGFGLMCDTGKGHYMIQGSDGFWYANGPFIVSGTGLTYSSSTTYLVCALTLNSSTDADIQALAASGYNGGTTIGHYVTGQSGKNGNANSNMGPVDDGPILGPCLKIKHGFGAVYAGWTGGVYGTGEIKYRHGYSDQTSWAASSANAVNGVYVTRGDAAGSNYFAP